MLSCLLAAAVVLIYDGHVLCCLCCGAVLIAACAVLHAAVAACCCYCFCRESAGMGGPLKEEEAHVIQGVLDLSSKTGSKAMTPLANVGVI